MGREEIRAALKTPAWEASRSVGKHDNDSRQFCLALP